MDDNSLDLAQQLLFYSDQSILIQGIFLNLIWIVLFWYWVLSFRKYPKKTLVGNAPTKLHWLIAAIAWVATGYVAVTEIDPKHLLFAFAIANGVGLSVLNPTFSLCFSLSMIMMRPWELMQDNLFVSALPRFSILFSFGWSFVYLLAHDRGRIRLNKSVLFLLGFVLLTFLSTFISENPIESRQEFNDSLVRSATLFFLIWHLCRDRFSVQAIKLATVLIFTCVGVISLVFYFQGYTEDGRIIAFGMFANSNDIAAVMTILLPFAIGPLVSKTAGASAKILSLFPTVIALAVLVFAQSRGAILSIIAIGGVWIIQKIKRKTLAAALIIAVLVGGQVVVGTFKRASGDMEGSTSSRMSFWKSGIRMGIMNPILGVGISRFDNNFEKYASEITGEYGARTAHSSWILAWAEVGPIGFLFFFLTMYFAGFKNAKRLLNKDPTWMYAVASYGISMTFLSHTYLVFPYLVIGMISAAASSSDLEDIIDEEERASTRALAPLT